jgi:hypothetical protein
MVRSFSGQADVEDLLTSFEWSLSRGAEEVMRKRREEIKGGSDNTLPPRAGANLHEDGYRPGSFRNRYEMASCGARESKTQMLWRLDGWKVNPLAPIVFCKRSSDKQRIPETGQAQSTDLNSSSQYRKCPVAEKP